MLFFSQDGFLFGEQYSGVTRRLNSGGRVGLDLVAM